jgi:adenylate cyclase
MMALLGGVVDAVRCAVEIQCRMSERNADVPDARRIEFRIGVNLGDVIVEPNDIYGGGVNVAALEATSAPNSAIVVLGSTLQDPERSWFRT